MMVTLNHAAQAQRKSAPAAAANPSGQPDAPAPQDSRESGGLKEFYHEYKLPIHVAGGALLGAGIASLTGNPQAVMSAAGGGAFAGWVADSPKRAVCMAGGAVIGASIAHMAGLPGPAILSAAGTGTFVGWLVG